MKKIFVSIIFSVLYLFSGNSQASVSSHDSGVSPQQNHEQNAQKGIIKLAGCTFQQTNHYY